MGETCRDVGRQAKTKLISVKTVEKFSSWHKRWNAEKSENWLNCVSKSFFTALVWNRRQLKRQNADSAITGTSHIQRWQQPNIVHLKNFQSFKYYMKCDIQIPNSQSHVCLTYYIDDINQIVSGYTLLFIKHDWNMKERSYLSLKKYKSNASKMGHLVGKEMIKLGPFVPMHFCWETSNESKFHVRRCHNLLRINLNYR